MADHKTPEEFGAHLRGVRELAGLTLRDVEQRTNQVVKNGYLSQIENGLIGRPSPGILYEIAQVYQVSYRDLLMMVGHRVPDEKAEQVPTQMTVLEPPIDRRLHVERYARHQLRWRT
jgi:transcriptional regulator with XRE-family HTH domain